MSKFNTEAIKTKLAGTTNHVGAEAYVQDSKTELAMAVLTTFIDDSFYESKDARLERIHALVDNVGQTDPEFVAKLAVYARTQFNMRSVFPVVIGRLTQVHRGDSLVSRAIAAGATRPDDLTELASYLDLKLTNQVKKGIAKAMNKFNSYSMAKYRGEGKTTKLVDLVNLTHPKASQTNTAVALKSLVNGTLKNEDTWEAQLSAGGDKATVFKGLLETNKLGYMALLRNLRNIQETGDAQLIQMAADRLVDEEAVIKSKQLPFRFLSAFTALEQAQSGTNNKVLSKAVEKALEISIRHLPTFDGDTMILTDNSGSMGGGSAGGSPVSAMSQTKTCDIANLFATMCWLKSENTYVGLFGDRLVSPKLDRSKSLFENFKICTNEAAKCGGSTEEGLFVAFEELIKSKRIVSRIMIFSDCQVGRDAKWYGTGKDYGSMSSRRADYFGKLYEEYRKINPNVKVYSVDLKGYGNAMVRDGAMCLSGWSEKIFDIMHKHEINGNALVQEINSVVL